MGRLGEKVVVITGAGRGIGRAYAHAMAAEGARVVVNDLGVSVTGRGPSAESAEAVASEIRAAGGEAVANADDVSELAGARGLVAAAVAHFGGLDALVNNAAIDYRASLEAHDAGAWDRVMAVNARGPLLCVQQAVAAMRERGGGAILNTTSGSFWEGTEGVAAYSASKAAVFALTLTQHQELHAAGIRSNCIAPNATRTRMLESWLEDLARESSRSEADVMAEYGIQAPENLAPLAVFLCSDAAREISGRIFEVQGDRIHEILPPQRAACLERDGERWDLDALARVLAGGRTP